MDTNAKTYTVQLYERYVYDLRVEASSPAEAIERALAFYSEHRKPETKYVEDGLTAVIQKNSVLVNRSTSGQSGWARYRARTAARGSDRDAA